MKKEMAKITELMKSLDGPELDELEKRVKAAKQFKKEGKSTPKYDPDVDLVLESLVGTMSRLGVEYTPAVALKKAEMFPSFAEKVPGLMKFVRKGAGSKNQQRVLLGLGFRLLYTSMTEFGWPTSSRLMMAHVHRVPSVINRNFPGYASAGLLGLLIGGELGD